MLNKLYEQGKDLHVANYVAYGKTADHKLYADEDFAETVTAAEVEDAVKKGRLVIQEGENTLFPLALRANGVLTADLENDGKTVLWAVSDPV